MNGQTQKDLIVAVVGGGAFAAVWIILELLLTLEPDLISGILGGIAAGIAWFVGTFIFRRLGWKSDQSVSEGGS